MPNRAAAVFKAIADLAAERGKDIGKFVQRGTTFEQSNNKVMIGLERITYAIIDPTKTGNEEYHGSFKIGVGSSREITQLINRLAQSKKNSELRATEAA